MRIAVTSQDGTGDFTFSGEPWNSFAENLLDSDDRLVSVYDNPDVLIMNNYADKLYRKSKVNSEQRSFLIIWEPPTNMPANFSEKNLNKFKQVYFPSPIWSKQYRGEYFAWPQAKKLIENQKKWEERQPRVCFIQANRWSFISGEQYSLRRKVLGQMNSHVDIFGSNWNLGILRDSMNAIKSLRSISSRENLSFHCLVNIGQRFDNYFGNAIDKIETLSDYRYSLVIENSLEYISEKLVDAILAGTVPIYVGPDLELCGFPSGIAITCKPEVNEIEASIRSLLTDRSLADSILLAGKRFITFPEFAAMENTKVLSDLARRISHKIHS